VIYTRDGRYLQECGLPLAALFGCPPPGAGRAGAGRGGGVMLAGVWPSSLVPVRKLAQRKTSAFGQPCPHLTRKAGYQSPSLELSPFFPKDTGPQQGPAALTAAGHAATGPRARLQRR